MAVNKTKNGVRIMRGKLAAMFGVFLAVLCLLISSPSLAADSRRAVLVMDVDSGKILSQENAYAKRYPASLTKMMTLYLLFDALRKGEVKMSSTFTASKYGASQPQTNISLRPGDKITVEDAIKALVVRSANDVAVVVAEGLGRSEWNFGVMMTQKSKELGMKNTVFRNPHGLPNARQYTTAYDMAVLGAALRRDFPQYYNYFTTNIFRYKGRTYTGHNRVIGRFDGVDGIKTGYINASGFNLVTSVKKDGYYVVAVIMGGYSGASRDNEMVSILQRTFTALESQKSRPRMVASAPAPVLNPKRAAIELAAANAASSAGGGAVAAPNSPAIIRLGLAEPEAAAQPPSSRFSFLFGRNAKTKNGVSPARHARIEPENSASSATEESVQAEGAPVTPVASSAPMFSASVTLDTKKAKAEQPVAPLPPVAAAGKKLPPKGTLEYQMALIESGQGDVGYDEPRDVLRGTQKNWGIQVGAFVREDQARDAVRRAFGLLQAEAADAYITISREGDAAKPIHRARLGNLSKTQADAACHKLAAARQSCFPVQME